MIRQGLEQANWTVRSAKTEPVPARVPGCVHTDLMRAGKIPDPYLDRNERLVQWIGETDWQYRCTFDADSKLFDHERIDLVCDGLDTIAKVELNGTLVGESFNMHHPHRFDVQRALKKGTNELVITFASPVKHAFAMRDKLGHLPNIMGNIPFNFIRKMACNFGWDWGPVLATCGIWRGIRLEGWSIARLASWSTILQEVTTHKARYRMPFEMEFGPGHGPKDVFVSVDVLDESGRGRLEQGRGEHPNRDASSVHVGITNPDRWWPIGHGGQPRYVFDVTLWDTRMHAEGATRKHVLDERRPRVGVRTVELDSHPDDIGRSFVLKVNGKPIFCKGFNWIPDDCFVDRATDSTRVRKRIEQALAANCNMLRVWGGGIYETEDFYNICDELGVLVWQDFPFACAAYPEAEPIRSQVETEARHNVARLSSHPSLVLWNGCNENLWGYHNWSSDDGTGKIVPWKDQLQGKQWGPGYYFDLLPKIVAEIDPSRPYWPASPWSGDRDVEHGLHPNLDTHGNTHIWEVWHGKGEYTNYRDFTPRFCSEFGYQGPANYSTLARALPPDQLNRGSEALELHQKSPGGNERNDRLLALHFNIPENFDDWHFLLQLNQARALKAGVEWFRSRQPTCMGTLIWQLNDCWPVTSWSAIDGDGKPKLLWYATKKFYAPRLLTIQPEKGELFLFANNDSDEPWNGEAIVRHVRFDGSVIDEMRIAINVAPRANQRFGPLAVSHRDPMRELIVAQLDDARADWFFDVDKNLAYPKPEFDASFDGRVLTIRAKTLIRDACVFVDRLDPEATISDQMVTLLPGEVAAFAIESKRAMTVEELTSHPVFNCASFHGQDARGT